MVSTVCSLGQEAKLMKCGLAGSRRIVTRLPIRLGCPVRAAGVSPSGESGDPTKAGPKGEAAGDKKRDPDYVYDVGNVDYNTNVTTGGLIWPMACVGCGIANGCEGVSFILLCRWWLRYEELGMCMMQ